MIRRLGVAFFWLGGIIAVAVMETAAMGGARLRSQQEQTISLNCRISGHLPVMVEIALDQRLVRFVNGPFLKISSVEALDGARRVSASSSLYQFEAVLGAGISVRFRSVPGAFDELTCSYVGGESASATR